MSQDRSSRRPPMPPTRSAEKRPTEGGAPEEKDASEQAPSKREPWIEQWLADEEDDIWNMPCTD